MDILNVDPLIECRFLERRNKFVVSVETEAGVQDAYISNTGRLQQILLPGRRLLCKPKERGRLPYVVIGAELGDHYAIVDTRLHEKVFELSFKRVLIPWLPRCEEIKRAPRFGKSVLDFLIPCQDLYIELKSAVYLSNDGCGSYPDAPTNRGERHIRDLIEIKRMGFNSALVFVVSIPGARCFKVYKDMSPEISDLVKKAYDKGVLVKAMAIHLKPDGWVVLDNPDIPVVF